jgi:hypothetical protein
MNYDLETIEKEAVAATSQHLPGMKFHYPVSIIIFLSTLVSPQVFFSLQDFRLKFCMHFNPAMRATSPNNMIYYYYYHCCYYYCYHQYYFSFEYK